MARAALVRFTEDHSADNQAWSQALLSQALAPRVATASARRPGSRRRASWIRIRTSCSGRAPGALGTSAQKRPPPPATLVQRQLSDTSQAQRQALCPKIELDPGSSLPHHLRRALSHTEKSAAARTCATWHAGRIGSWGSCSQPRQCRSDPRLRGRGAVPQRRSRMMTINSGNQI